MKQTVVTYSGAVYTVTDQRLVQGGSKKLEAGILLNPPVQVDKCLLMYTPERAEIRAMGPPAPGAVPAVESSYVVTIEEIHDPLLDRLIRALTKGTVKRA